MTDAIHSDDTVTARRVRQVLLVVVVAGSVGAVGWTLWRERQAAQNGACEPNGGLRCNGAAIELCEDGVLSQGVPCTGGCTEDGGVARCTTEAGAITAPVGAVCQAGMSVCSHDAVSLLVCKDGRLAVGAACPKGCVDQGEGKGLFCLDEADGIRFAEGFPCPGFSRASAEPELACGPDGEALLVCKDGLLALDASRRCHPCQQSRTGALTCAGATTAAGP